MSDRNCLNGRGPAAYGCADHILTGGADILRAEMEYLRWYARQVADETFLNDMQVHVRDCYGKCQFPYHEGETGDYYRPLHLNAGKIAAVVRHYGKIFADDEAPVHGDFSLGNIIFKGDDVSWIIDWENANRCMPRCYDLIYLITENCLFCRLTGTRIADEDTAAYRRLYREISDKYEIPAQVADGPGQWCSDVVRRYMEKTGIDHSKCPFIAVEGKIIREVDEILKRNGLP